MGYRNIIHIDDDEDDQEIFCTALEPLSTIVNCISFSDARTALQNLIEKIVEPEAIFLDLNMPLMNGEEFLTEIKQLDTLRHIPVIILTTSAHTATMTKLQQLGAAAFLTKPNSLHELSDMLKKILI